MAIASFVVSLIALIGTLLALIPLLGWVNWITLGLATLGVILGIIGLLVSGRSRGFAVAGLVLSVIAFCIGVPRLIIGLGVL